MSDHRIHHDAEADGPGTMLPTMPAGIDRITNRPGMPVEDRQTGFPELADQVAPEERTVGVDEFAPLDVQIGEALAMLAQGGHLYGSPGAELEDEVGPDGWSADAAETTGRDL